MSVQYPDGVWETDGGLTDDDARMDWPVLRNAPGWQSVVTGPSGHKWRWRPWPRYPAGTVRHFEVDPDAADRIGRA